MRLFVYSMLLIIITDVSGYLFHLQITLLVEIQSQVFQGFVLSYLIMGLFSVLRANNTKLH